jgi:hypothetical protein
VSAKETARGTAKQTPDRILTLTRKLLQMMMIGRISGSAAEHGWEERVWEIEQRAYQIHEPEQGVW